METIAVEKIKQKKLNERVKKIKKQLKKGLIPKKPVASQKKKKVKPVKEVKGVIYLGHIPHGFYEDQIRAYCSQFGRVTRVRVARSCKTGRSKGYAFVEFTNPEVAKIVAETINNYLMFKRRLICQYIPPEKRHRTMFLRMQTEDSFRAQKNRINDDDQKNCARDETNEERLKKRRRRKMEDFKTFFEQRGIEFNFKVNDPNVSGEAAEVISSEPVPDPVLEIDESDDEVEFNTPPHVTKVFKNAPSRKSLTLRRLSDLKPVVKLSSVAKSTEGKKKAKGLAPKIRAKVR